MCVFALGVSCRVSVFVFIATLKNTHTYIYTHVGIHILSPMRTANKETCIHTYEWKDKQPTKSAYTRVYTYVYIHASVCACVSECLYARMNERFYVCMQYYVTFPNASLLYCTLLCCNVSWCNALRSECIHMYMYAHTPRLLIFMLTIYLSSVCSMIRVCLKA